MKYFARVVRPRFEVGFVELELDDAVPHQVATQVALEKAQREGVKWELREFDEDRYQPHVEMVLSDFDMEAEGDNPEEGREWMRSPEGMAHDRYLLLHADVDMGEGRVLHQPWVQECYRLLIHDIAEDWNDGLTELNDEFDNGPQGPAEILSFPSGKRSDSPDDT
jgi:hypothetical protein